MGSYSESNPRASVNKNNVWMDILGLTPKYISFPHDHLASKQFLTPVHLILVCSPSSLDLFISSLELPKVSFSTTMSIIIERNRGSLTPSQMRDHRRMVFEFYEQGSYNTTLNLMVTSGDGGWLKCHTDVLPSKDYIWPAGGASSIHLPSASIKHLQDIMCYLYLHYMEILPQYQTRNHFECLYEVARALHLEELAGELSRICTHLRSDVSAAAAVPAPAAPRPATPAPAPRPAGAVNSLNDVTLQHNPKFDFDFDQYLRDSPESPAPLPADSLTNILSDSLEELFRELDILSA